MKIQTDPPGAIVIVNDEEVGVSPVKVAFVWYGDYDLMFRKSGYKTKKTHERLDPPWWQVPPLDLVTESFLPQLFRDDRTLPAYALEPADPEPKEQIVERAVELRERALYEGEAPSDGQP